MRQNTLEGLESYKILAAPGHGQIPSEFMFVGISAGRLGALKTCVPFTRGPSGRVFQRMLGRLGLSGSSEFSHHPKLRNCYVTNFVKGIILTASGLNRPPTREEMNYWYPTLWDEFDRVKPRVVIALGSLVGEYLGEMASFESFLRVAKHPRYYHSHGALSSGHPMFERMVTDFREILGIE